MFVGTPIAEIQTGTHCPQATAVAPGVSGRCHARAAIVLSADCRVDSLPRRKLNDLADLVARYGLSPPACPRSNLGHVLVSAILHQ